MSTSWPTPSDLRSAARIDLSREPATAEAQRFVEAVTSLAVQYKATKRAVAGKGLKTWHRDVGIILGGLLRRNVVASAQRNRSGPMWTPGELPIGLDAFWSRVDAMTAAGLVAEERGTRQPCAFSGGFTGHPTRLWARDALWDMAAAHGLPDDAWKSHWAPPHSPVAPRSDRELSRMDLVQLRPLKQAVGRFRENTGEAMAIPPALEATAEAMREGVARLNAAVAAVEVRGVKQPRFCRQFRHDLRLGGRFYTIGAGTFSNMPRTDRARITINGEPVVEVDLEASHATILLALRGFGDLADGVGPYDVPGVTRAVCKAFWTQSIGTGFPAMKWSDRVDAEVRKVSLKAVREAVTRRFPAMMDMVKILPADLLASLPASEQGRAVGQFLAFMESEVIAAALDTIGTQGGVALPLHDSLIVPASGAGQAEAALSAAFLARFGVVPRIKVK